MRMETVKVHNLQMMIVNTESHLGIYVYFGHVGADEYQFNVGHRGHGAGNWRVFNQHAGRAGRYGRKSFNSPGAAIRHRLSGSAAIESAVNVAVAEFLKESS